MNAEELLERYKEGSITKEELRKALIQLKAQEKVYPLSEGQKGLWMLDKMVPDNSSYNLPICFQVKEKINSEIFQEALNYVLETYPVLNQVIIEDKGVLCQKRDTRNRGYLETYKSSNLNEAEIISLVKEKVSEKIDLAKGALLKSYLFDNGERGSIVLIVVHHIVFDGSSIEILIDALLNAYVDLLQGKQPARKNSAKGYHEFVLWQQNMLQGNAGASHKKYWKEQLAGELPVLELPTDAVRKKEQTFNGETVSIILGTQIKESAIAFVKREAITLPVYFLGIFNMLLNHYTGQDEFVIGMAHSGRTEEEFEQAIGYFINVVPIRTNVIRKEKFREYLKQLCFTMMDGMDHADYPFALMTKELELVRSTQHSPVYQAAYYYQNFMSNDAIGKYQNFRETLHVEFVEEIHQEGENELTLEIFEQETGFRVNLKYNSDLYKRSTMTYMAANFKRLVEETLMEPEKELWNYEKATKAEKEMMAREWNQTFMEYDKTKCVYELFSEQAKRTPDEIAVIYENTSLTYKELDDRSSILAVYLQKKGVKADVLVGLSLDRSLNMVVALLGILKAGGAYVPLDPIYPNDRLSYMIANSKIEIVLTQESLVPKMKELTGEGRSLLVLDTQWEEIQASVGQSQQWEKSSSAHNLAYVLYTSGSTGNPKGVMIPHKALTNFLLSMKKNPGMVKEDKLLAVTTICFDIAGLEMYLPLIVGAKCYVCSTEKQKNMEKLKEEIKRIKPSIMQATPATWNALFKLGWKNEENVKILCGGEALPEQLRQCFLETKSNVYNMFGPTETTIWSTVKHIVKDEPVTIGTPIANTQIYILDEDKNIVPVRATGELYIGGDGLAKGYLNMPEKTAERFIDNPFEPGTKLYATGDSARWMANGEIEFIGRIDNQVKINGFRIELNEIETILNKFDGIKDSVAVISDNNGAKQLRAFYTWEKRDSKMNQKELRAYLKKWLPSYMVPSVFVEIAEIPFTPNGKINRLALSKMKIEQPEKSKKPEYRQQEINKPTESTQKNTDIEHRIHEIWTELIRNDEISLEDGFFEAGGDSITAVMAAEQISTAFSCEVSVTDIFEYTSIRELAKNIAQKTNNDLQEDSRGDNWVPEENKYYDRKNQNYPDYYKDSIAIIGMSCQFPGASDKKEFWNNIKNGVESIHRLSEEELIAIGVPEEIRNNKDYIPAQSSLDGKEFFDPSFFKISHKDAQMMDPQMRLLLMNSWKAIEDAGYTPEQVPNTSVYMATSNNSYQAEDVQSDMKIIKDANSYVKWLFGQGGTVPTMISYQLGLKGASYSVHSNCSSALVGLYQAFHEINMGSSEYALVGASTIHSLINAGYVYVPGLSFSSDGHIKAFDDAADGMVGGEGVAVVMLKNAAKAVEDGDHIYTIVRTVQVNNDGHDKVGFYAPSIQGQSELIDRALSKAKINPETIRFVEAHGTGTNIGDPIEFASLNSVYRKYTQKRNYCGLGSVKTNIGHLDTAAGMAGMVKIALSMEHGQIPPTINFNKINKKIAMDNSPFFIVENLTVFEKQELPYRAALSSFGIGGTNVHVIFEEYKEEKEQNKKQLDQTYLVPVSAKKEEQLKEYVQNLLLFAQRETFELADLAYTMQVGRVAFEEKIIFIVKSKEELIRNIQAYLDGAADNNSCLVKQKSEKEEVVQLLSEDFELLSKSWIEKERFDKLAVLWLQGFAFDWSNLYGNGNIPRRISCITYPFAKEVYVRKLNTKTDSQSKTIVSSQNLHPLVQRNISDFAEQKYATTLTGKEFFLVDHVINSKEVLPGVAYIEMARASCEMAIKAPVSVIRNIVWPSPVIVEESCDVEIVLQLKEQDIEYKVRTLENGVEIIHSQGRIDPASSVSVMDDEEPFAIEECIKRCDGYIGHDDFYATDENSVYQYGKTFRPIQEMYYSKYEVISRIELPKERKKEFAEFGLHPSLLEGCLQTIVGLMSASGVTPFMPFSIEKIEILRPFKESGYVHAMCSEAYSEKAASRKYNVNFYDEAGNLLIRIHNYMVRDIITPDEDKKYSKTENSEVYYEEAWKKSDITNSSLEKLEHAVVITDAKELREQAISSGAVFILAGDEYQKVTSNEYIMNVGIWDHYLNLLKDLQEDGRSTDKIVQYISGNSFCNQLEDGKKYTAYYVFEMVKAFLSLKGNTNMQMLLFVEEHEREILPYYEAVAGMAKTIQLEQKNFFCKIIEGHNIKETLIEKTKKEFADNDANIVRYKNERMILKLQEKKLDNRSTSDTVPFKEKGVYLITGGAGAIGERTTLFLAKEYKARIAVIGRSEAGERIQQLEEKVNNAGGQFLYIQGDIASEDAAVKAVKQVQQKYQEIHGVFHCAGVLRDSLVRNKSLEQLEEVLAPKINGCVYIDEATKLEKLDFFCMFSSVSYLGNVGQADYAYANAFMNAYAKLRKQLADEGKRYGNTVSICWPVWENGSMQVSEQVKRFMKAEKGILPVSDVTGMKAMTKMLLEDCGTIIFYFGDATKIRQSNQVKDPKQNKTVIVQKQIKKMDSEKAAVKIKNRGKREEMNKKELLYSIRDYLLEQVKGLLETEEIGLEDDMSEYGLDSIRNTEFANIINDYYHLNMMPTVFFELEELTIQCLAEFLVKEHEKELLDFYKDSIPVHMNNSEAVSQEELEPVSEEKTNVLQLSRERFQQTEKIPQLIQKNQPISDVYQERDDRIAIIGMDGVLPQSENLWEFWDNIEQEKDLVQKVPKDRFDCDLYEDSRMHWGAFMKEVDKFDAPFFKISQQEAEVMDPQHRMFLQVVWGALEDAGYRPSQLSGTNTGIFAGIGTQDYTEYLDRLEEDNPYILTGRTPFMLVNRISSMLNLHGPSEPVDTACSSSLLAVHRAAEEIREGHCDLAIAGGVNIILTPTVHHAFSKAGMLSASGTCRVFDKHADGTVRGEGVGAVILKRLSDAVQDGDHIYAVIKSSVENHKGKTTSLTAPNSTAETELVSEAYRKAKISPDTVQYIETHSTGTRLGDPIEINGLKQAFKKLYKEHNIQQVSKHCALSSLKTNMGHLEAAAGIASLLKAVMAMRNKKLPGIRHFEQINPYIDLEGSPLYLNLHTKDWERIEENIPRRAGVSAFGFGGVNVHILLEEYMDEEEEKNIDKQRAVITLSARTEQVLRTEARRFLDSIERNHYSDKDLINIAYTLQTGREEMEERVAFTADSMNELKNKLAALEKEEKLSKEFYRGQAGTKDELVNILSEDDGIEFLVATWIQNNEYDKLLRFWVKGLKVDWNLFYNGKEPKRVSLPAYPFEKIRYWIKENGEINNNVAKQQQKMETKAPAVKKPENNGTDIKKVLAELLNTEPDEIEESDRLEELGVDSIILTQLLKHIQILNQEVDFEMLYLCKTIEDILSLAKANQNSNNYYIELVRLNKSSDKTPVFWFHGGFGGIEVYRFIAGSIERPFYGIQAKGYMTNDEPIQGIENMASYYVSMIQSVQPHGPYDLGGLSLGGMIAYEVARQLKEKGEEVKSIIMLETIFVDEGMKEDWMNLPTEKLRKDRMLRAVNLLMAFSSDKELMMISEDELDLESSDEEFLDRLVTLAIEKGDNKPKEQLKQSIIQLEKILWSLDMGSTTYEVKPLAKAEETTCYYFCNPESSLFGEAEANFRLVDKGRVYNYGVFSEKWRSFLPDTKVLRINSSNHLTILVEETPQREMIQFCKKLYDDENAEEIVEKMKI